MSKFEKYEIGALVNLSIYLGDIDRSLWKEKGKRRTSLFTCSYCGTNFITVFKEVKSGHTRSCGCLNKAVTLLSNTTHGLSKSRFYRIWFSMKDRCTNPNITAYERYGGRGITFQDSWKNFNNFLDDMIETYSDDLEIDRIDPDGNYTKENCRWVNSSIQSYNQRIRNTNKSGRTGVSFHKVCQRWAATICENGKQRHLGLFENFEDACKVREDAEMRIYGFIKK